MSMVDLSKIIKEHSDEWVALTSDHKKLIASGKSLAKVLKLANKSGIKDPSVLKIPDVNTLFVG